MSPKTMPSAPSVSVAKAPLGAQFVTARAGRAIGAVGESVTARASFSLPLRGPRGLSKVAQAKDSAPVMPSGGGKRH